MNESLLHFVWQYRLFNNTNLNTVPFSSIEIIDPGLHNSDAGPDFFNAKIRLDGMVWAGNIEMHIDGNDWYKHGHNKDDSYNNTILHVVLESPVTTMTNKGVEVPVLQITIPKAIIEKYNSFQLERYAQPCFTTLNKISQLELNGWLDRMLIEKLEVRSSAMKMQLQSLDNNWEELFFRSLARSFGLGINADAFELWAKSFSVNILKKHRNNLVQIEAMCFGQAGFLNESFPDDEYANTLVNEYRFLRTKYQLTPIDVHIWRFLRLRPANFPTVRLAQLASLLNVQENLFDFFIRNSTSLTRKELFSRPLSGYWQNHYKFGTVSTVKQKKIGCVTQDAIMLNAIVPMMFLYGQKTNNSELEQKAIELLTAIAPEKNSIITSWHNAGVVCTNATQSQALIYLTKNYCQYKKCLRCRIGHIAIAKRLA